MFACASCKDETDFGEQYKKTVYIVKSNNLLYTASHRYGEENRMELSIYCASSEPLAEDLRVRVKIDPKALDSLNSINILENSDYVNKVMLPESHYSFTGEQEVVIKAGEQYSVLEIPFDTEGLNSDTSYTIPLSIVSNSAGYDVNPELKSIVYEIRLENKFSGTFSGTSAESPNAIRPVQVEAKAISANRVRIPIHNIDASNLDTDFMLLTVTDGQVTVEPWENSTVVDLGVIFYDEVQQLF
jgi:hypothetical protein